MRFLLFAVNFSCRTLESNADQPKMLRFVDPPKKNKIRIRGSSNSATKNNETWRQYLLSMSYSSPSPLLTNEIYNKQLNDNHHVEVTSSPKILQPSVTSAQHLMRTLSPSGTYIDKLKDVPHLEIFLSPKIRIPTNIQLSVATIKKSMPSSLTATPTNAYSIF